MATYSAFQFLTVMAKLCIAGVLLWCAVGCEDNPAVPDFQPDTSLVFISREFELGDGYFTSGVWIDSNIYYASPFRTLTLSPSFTITKDSTLKLYRKIIFLHADQKKQRILYVESQYITRSEGSLYEFDILSGTHRELLDTSFHVSSAVYTPDNTIIYYSYHHPGGAGAGYYQLNPVTGQHALVLPYLSDLGVRETVNGFDIHPDGSTLLIPVTRADQTPVVVRYHRDHRTLDTLPVEFDLSYNRVCLWLRYNRAGSKILYSHYPVHSLSIAPSDGGEVGVIDAATGQKTIIPLRPYREEMSINIFPSWSPDERHIVFGSAPVSLYDGGIVGVYQLIIKKNAFVL